MTTIIRRTLPVARRTIAALLVLVAPLAAQQQARQTPPTGGRPRDFRVPAGRTVQLDNGMGINFVQYGSVPKAQVLLIVRSGNLNEAGSQVWLSDLMTDLMREGTTTRNAAAISAQAAAMGGDVFTGTGLDQSTVQGDVLGEAVPEMIRLVADVAMHPAFPESELARIKANRGRNLAVQLRQPGAMTLRSFRETMYPDHPYGRLFPTPEQLNGYSIDQIRAFYAANWGAARAQLYVVGRFDERAAEAAARETFGSWQRGADAITNVPAPVARRALVTNDRPQAPQSTLIVGVPVANPSSADWIPQVVTNTMLGGYFSSRITANIREDKGYTYSPFSSLSSRYHDTYWAEQADVTTAHTGASLREIFFEIDRLRSEAPPAADLESAQNYLSGIFVLNNSSRFGIANQLGFVRLQGLDRTYLTNYVRNVMAVTPADVQRVAQTYLDPGKMLISVTGDLNVIREQIAPYGAVVP